jgi:hypothetical protein
MGEELVAGIVDTLDADMRLAVRRRALAANQYRLRTINEDFRKLVDELNAN